MRKIFLTLAMVSAFTGHASGADLPSRKAPPVAIAPMPAFSWTGFYVGVQGGYQWAKENGLWADAALNGESPYANNAVGGLFGGHIGFNWQVANVVLGLEGDANAAVDFRGATATVYNSLGLNGNPVGTSLYPIHVQQAANGDIRARLGYAIDRTLLYVAGGVAFGDVKTTYFTPLNAPPSVPYLSVSTQRVGWTIGAGVEYAFTNSILGRVEYRHTDLGSRAFVHPGSGGGDYDNVRFRSNAVLVGLTYKFGAPGVLVASH